MIAFPAHKPDPFSETSYVVLEFACVCSVLVDGYHISPYENRTHWFGLLLPSLHERIITDRKTTAKKMDSSRLSMLEKLVSNMMTLPMSLFFSID